MGLGILVNGFLQIGRADGAEKSLPMTGEGIAMGHRHYFFGNRHDKLLRFKNGVNKIL